MGKFSRVADVTQCDALAASACDRGWRLATVAEDSKDGAMTEHSASTPPTSSPLDATNPAPATEPRERAFAALKASGIAFEITEHGRVNSLEEAAAARGVEPRDIVKSLVVRISQGRYAFALVSGDRQISWPKFRKVMGVSRVHMPDAQEAFDVTGFVRGTITPFGSLTEMEVIVDEPILGRKVSIGAGAHGVAATVDADQMVEYLGATVADIGE